MTSVVSVGPEGPLSYLDRSPSIVPYTTYEYRVRVSNPVGSSNSLWEEVTTKPARKLSIEGNVVSAQSSKVKLARLV